MKDVGEERKGRSWDKPFWHMHTMMGFPWIDVAVCPNEQREYTGSHCSKLLIWPHVCMCVRVNVSLSVTCLCFCLQVESTDARNACWQKWMYMWDRMREIERVRAVRSHTDMNQGSSYESEPPPFFHSFIPHVQLPPPLFHLFFPPSPTSISLSCCFDNLHLYLSSVSQKEETECAAVMRGCLCLRLCYALFS